MIGERIEKITEVEYVFQELDDLPEGLRNRLTARNPGEPDRLYLLQRRFWMSHLLLSMQMIIMGKKLM